MHTRAVQNNELNVYSISMDSEVRLTDFRRFSIRGWQFVSKEVQII